MQVALWVLSVSLLRWSRWSIECSAVVVLSAKLVLSCGLSEMWLLEHWKMTGVTKLNWNKMQISSGTKGLKLGY
jgi:hypothetical protein